jgi:hypothetical protein
LNLSALAAAAPSGLPGTVRLGRSLRRPVERVSVLEATTAATLHREEAIRDEFGSHGRLGFTLPAEVPAVPSLVDLPRVPLIATGAVNFAATQAARAGVLPPGTTIVRAKGQITLPIDTPVTHKLPLLVAFHSHAADLPSTDSPSGVGLYASASASSSDSQPPVDFSRFPVDSLVGHGRYGHLASVDTIVNALTSAVLAPLVFSSAAPSALSATAFTAVPAAPADVAAFARADGVVPGPSVGKALPAPDSRILPLSLNAPVKTIPSTATRLADALLEPTEPVAAGLTGDAENALALALEGALLDALSATLAA